MIMGSALEPRPGMSEFFLVVPNNGGTEDDYGSGEGGKRTPSPFSCYPQSLIDECAAGL